MGGRALPVFDLGEYCLVGTGAVVNRSVPPHSVVAGVPARVIRELQAEEC